MGSHPRHTGCPLKGSDGPTAYGTLIAHSLLLKLAVNEIYQSYKVTKQVDKLIRDIMDIHEERD